MLSDKSKQQLSEWWDLAKIRFSELLSIGKLENMSSLVGLVITPQYIKLLKIKPANSHYEIEYFNVVHLSEGLVVNNEIKNPQALANILKDIFNDTKLKDRNITFAIPRSSAIIKTITMDKRLQADEIESKVWLEAGKLFPNLIGDIYLDFAVMGPTSNDDSQIEVLVVACRKEQIKTYLEVMRLADLNVKVIDVNYYAYERALSLITKQTPQFKTIVLLNIGFRLIDVIVIEDGNLIYTHEVSYDGKNLLKLMQNMEANLNGLTSHASSETGAPENQATEILKNTIGSHLKHAIQFFYSSRPNTRIDKILLGGDVAAAIPSMVDFVKQEVGKDVVLADPFKDMKFAASIDQAKLLHYSPTFMLCCGLALTNFIQHGRS